jgi:hypothetical protein
MLLTDKDLTDKQLLDIKLRNYYQDLKDYFLKATSNTLPPHRLYNYKIKLKGAKETDLSYCLLC